MSPGVIRGPTVRAIDLIVEQGEGSPEDREDSHYRRFVAIRSEYDALSRANPAFAPAWRWRRTR